MSLRDGYIEEIDGVLLVIEVSRRLLSWLLSKALDQVLGGKRLVNGSDVSSFCLLDKKEGRRENFGLAPFLLGQILIKILF